MVTLCVDAGTSIIKTVAFDDRGAEVSVVRQETKVLRPRAGFSEQDMDAVWEAVASTIRRMVPGLAEPVRFLSVTAQGDGVWLVDENGRPTGPAITVERRARDTDHRALAGRRYADRGVPAQRHAGLRRTAQRDFHLAPAARSRPAGAFP